MSKENGRERGEEKKREKRGERNGQGESELPTERKIALVAYSICT